jgi:hypothetical protein
VLAAEGVRCGPPLWAATARMGSLKTRTFGARTRSQGPPLCPRPAHTQGCSSGYVRARSCTCTAGAAAGGRAPWAPACWPAPTSEAMGRSGKQAVAVQSADRTDARWGNVCRGPGEQGQPTAAAGRLAAAWWHACWAMSPVGWGLLLRATMRSAANRTRHLPCATGALHMLSAPTAVACLPSR